MKISKRTPVTDLRSIWSKETEFSDWLVTDDGLELIASDIGVQIEEPKRESRPGNYPCDIVGHAVGDESHIVIVENQFNRTNHDHLGKLLTYASAHSAATAIWISEEVSDDHRKVIDWLNDNTPPTLSFYLAQIKAYQIDASPVAPVLEVVSRPNIETKLQRSNTDDVTREIESWRKDFWQEILSFIKSMKPPFSVQSATVAHWSNITIGRSNIYIELTLTPKRQCIGCELRIRVPWKDDAFTQLQDQKALIEQEIGASLQWLRSAGTKLARILLEVPIDPANDANRDQVKQWMYEKSIAFYMAFHDRVKALKPNISALAMATNIDTEDD